MLRLMSSTASKGASMAYRKLKIILWKGIKFLARGHLALVSRTGAVSCQHSGSGDSVIAREI